MNPRLDSSDEPEQVRDLRGVAALALHEIDGRLKAQLRGEQEMEGVLQRGDLGVREAATPQPHRVETREAGAVAGHLGVGDGVPAHHRVRCGEGGFADAHELVDARHGAEDHVVFQHHVARQRREAGQNAVVADPAVMRDVHVVEDEVPVADQRAAAPIRAPDVDRRELPDHVVLADHQRRVLAGCPQHLRLAADHGKGTRCACGRRYSCDPSASRGSRPPPLVSSSTCSPITA